jgi:S-adenosylmethionine:tRNA ribosyltransferase-isomerase
MILPNTITPQDPQGSLAPKSGHPRDLRISDFHYELPQDRIAMYPANRREEARMLEYRGGVVQDRTFAELGQRLPAGAHLVLNNTRVVPARLRWPLPSGSLVEFLLLEPELNNPAGDGMAWWCMIGNNRAWKSGVLDLDLPGGHLRIVRGPSRDGQWLVNLSWEAVKGIGPNEPQSLEELLDLVGEVPLPPYLQRKSEELDRERYQTTYARERGAVAAPTAGLHLTPSLLEQIVHRGGKITEGTLHVGAGTFQPVKATNMAEHGMHTERISIRVEALEALYSNPTPVYAVGTTSLRLLESLYWAAVHLHNNSLHASSKPGSVQLPRVEQWDPYTMDDKGLSSKEALEILLEWAQKNECSELSGRTGLLIAPPYKTRMIQGLITNFHQPQSTLLLLVAALVGDDWRKIYQHALDQGYRFLSYGDGSLLHL